MNILTSIRIDEHSRVPKYKQIVEAIVFNVSIGKLKINDKIPSINDLSEELYLSRDTVERAYKILKKRKIIASVKGKGSYVSSTTRAPKLNILFLINKLSSYKMMVYNSFVGAMGNHAKTFLNIYNCNSSFFLSLLEDNLGVYDYYILMPHFVGEDLSHVSSTKEVLFAIDKIPREKLIILDNNNLKIEGDVVEIFQDFEKDILNSLEEALVKIKKYKRIVMVYPSKGIYPYPKRILRGFKTFCYKHAIDFEIREALQDDLFLRKKELYITIEESDLVTLIKRTREEKFELGNDLGVISYNDTPLKQLLGITVISTDFKAMGVSAAQMIQNNKRGKIKNPFYFIDRGSS